MSIKRDLQLGSAGEEKVKGIYQSFGCVCSGPPVKGRFPDWDIHSVFDSSTGKVEFTTEVKWDIYAAKSGNIAIEIYNPKSGKDSGLTATKADLWVHITDEVYVTSVKKLRQFVKKEIPFRVIGAGGDDNATLLLFKEDHILSIFTSLEGLSKVAGRKIIKELTGN